jgi:membrane fusion protein, multidrug efflux system
VKLKKSTPWLIALASVALALAMVPGCASSGANEKGAGKDGAASGGPGGGGGQKGGAPGGAPGGQKKRAYPVRVQQASVQAVTYELQAIGSLEPKDVYRIDARVPGTIYDVNFNEGDTVTTDQVLCTIAPEAYRLAMLRAKAIYEQAVANLADLKRKNSNAVARAKIDLSRASLEIARRRGVQEAGAISDEEIQLYESRRDLAAVDLKDMEEAAQTEIRAMEASIAEKEASWKIAEDDLRKSTVKPPINGTIERRMVTNMVFVTPGMELARIVDTSLIKLRFKIAEKEASAVKEGGKVSFSVPAWPNEWFEAEIYHIDNQLDEAARTLECWAKVTKGTEKLKAGFFTSVRIVTGGDTKAVVIPSTAVLPTEKGFVVYVAKDGKAEQRMVKTGLTVTDNSVEILSGITPGETLVVEGANALQPGSPLKILPPQGGDEQPAPQAPAPKEGERSGGGNSRAAEAVKTADKTGGQP